MTLVLNMISACKEDSGLKKRFDKLDIITPHRLSIAILIRNYCLFRDLSEYRQLDDGVKAKYRKEFCILILRLMQSPDLALEELWNLLTSKKYSIPNWLKQSFHQVLEDLNTQGTGNLLDIIDSLNNRVINFNDNLPTDPNKCFVSKSSVIGYYLRRLIINFDKLTFTEVTDLYHAFQRYFSSSTLSSSCDESKVDINEWSGDKDMWTKRQAELFIATQAALIENNEEKSMSPKELQDILKNILKTNPSLAEAHFLSYLNCLRVKEFCGAVNSLFHCFDKSFSGEATRITGTDSEKSTIYRFAALNLAVLHYYFGHQEEALTSLKETIRISQDVNDNVCLQHALSWLYRLTITNKDKLIEHSVLKSFDLNLTYTTSLGIQTFVQLACLASGKPYQIFETLNKSDIINCQNNHQDLISNSFAVKSSLWQFYGKPEMSSLWSQLLLYLNIDNPKPNKAYYGEAFCLSICNIANYLVAQGEYNLANCCLDFIKTKFSDEPSSSASILCENLFIFTRALYHENWKVAESAAQKIMVVDEWESFLRLTELYLYKEDYAEAYKCVQIIIDKYENDTKFKFKGYQYVRAKLLLAEIQFASAVPNSVPSGILDLLSTCLIETNKYQLDYYTALIHMHIANVQLVLGMTSQALKVLDKCMIQIMAHAGNYDRARCMLLYVKCLIADSAKSQDRKETTLKGIHFLESVKTNFQKVEAYSRVKDVLMLQAQLYDFLNLKIERNKCALEFRILDEEHISQNACKLIKFL